MIIQRIGKPDFEVKRGIEVDIYINKDNQYRGTVTGISEARKQIKIGTLEYGIGFIYPAGTFTKAELEKEPKKPIQKLSKILAGVSKEPPGGWNSADMV